MNSAVTGDMYLFYILIHMYYPYQSTNIKNFHGYIYICLSFELYISNNFNFFWVFPVSFKVTA